MPRGIPNKKVTPEEDDLAVVGTTEGTPQPGEQIDGQGPELASYEPEEDEVDEYQPVQPEYPELYDEEELDEEASIQPADNYEEELDEDDHGPQSDCPDLVDDIMNIIVTAIQSYQEWLRKGVSPDTAFFESKLHDAIKDVKVEDWF